MRPRCLLEVPGSEIPSAGTPFASDRLAARGSTRKEHEWQGGGHRPEQAIGKLSEARPCAGRGDGRATSDAQGDRAGRLVSPARRRQAVVMLKDPLGISKRRACGIVGQHHSTQRA